MTTRITDAAAAPALRRQRVLEAAMAVFFRYGFRKTSMEEVARAAHISRQGLYLHFPTKEELFSAAARHLLDSALEAASDALAGGTTIEEKLVGAFDQWVGRYAGVFDGEAADLKETGEHLVGDFIRERDEDFLKLITKTVRASGLSAAHKAAGVGARELAETLHAAALGLKHTSSSREDFGRRMGIAVRAMCIPTGKSH